MTISSRTPEGDRNDCPICGKRVFVDPTRPPSDAPCPHCGTLLWFEREKQRWEPIAQKESRRTPGERAFRVGASVIAFKSPCCSGGAQGYLGRVIRFLPSTVADGQGPERWAYRVHIPSLSSSIEAETRSLIPVEGAALPLLMGEKLQFDLEPQADANRVFGASLLADGEWGYFAFLKKNIGHASYRILSAPAGSWPLPRCLVYEVPRGQSLDRDFVTKEVEHAFTSWHLAP